jgi:hypothetical protein
MTPANFRSVGGIHALVDRLLTSRADAPAL